MSVENGENIVVAVLFILFFGGMLVPSLKHRWDKRNTAKAEP